MGCRMAGRGHVAVLVAWRAGVASRLPSSEGLGGGFPYRLRVAPGSLHWNIAVMKILLKKYLRGEKVLRWCDDPHMIRVI